MTEIAVNAASWNELSQADQAEIEAIVKSTFGNEIKIVPHEEKLGIPRICVQSYENALMRCNKLHGAAKTMCIKLATQGYEVCIKSGGTEPG